MFMWPYEVEEGAFCVLRKCYKGMLIPLDGSTPARVRSGPLQVYNRMVQSVSGPQAVLERENKND